jgi:hypothetical protein
VRTEKESSTPFVLSLSKHTNGYFVKHVRVIGVILALLSDMDHIPIN